MYTNIMYVILIVLLTGLVFIFYFLHKKAKKIADIGLKSGTQDIKTLLFKFVEFGKYDNFVVFSNHTGNKFIQFCINKQTDKIMLSLPKNDKTLTYYDSITIYLDKNNYKFIEEVRNNDGKNMLFRYYIFKERDLEEIFYVTSTILYEVLGIQRDAVFARADIR